MQFCWNVEVWAAQKHVHFVDFVKIFLTSTYLQNQLRYRENESLKAWRRFNSVFQRFTPEALVDMRRQNNAQQPKSVQLQRPVAGATPQASVRCCASHAPLSRLFLDHYFPDRENRIVLPTRYPQKIENSWKFSAMFSKFRDNQTNVHQNRYEKWRIW